MTEDIRRPFSKKIKKDSKLQYSNDKFEENLRSLRSTKNDPLEKFINSSPYPDPYTLADFANKSYINYTENYAEELHLSDGWELLTAAGHPLKTQPLDGNGYFGVAFLHRERQQIVIAHRGSIPSLGSIKVDIKAIFAKQIAHPHVDSAITFCDRIKKAVQDCGKSDIFIFITGHSLGAWLAQVTTLTTQYLHFVDSIAKLDTNCARLSVHTVVFDSPGCKEVLEDIKDKYDLRSDFATISIKDLDIVSYLSAPNWVNTYGKHYGTLYRVFIEIDNLNEDDEHNSNSVSMKTLLKKCVKSFKPLIQTGFSHTLRTHSMEKIRKVMKAKEIKEVVDWPNFGSEFQKYLKTADKSNNFEPNIEIHNESKNKNIRYQTTRSNQQKVDFCAFTQPERNFIEILNLFREQKSKIESVFAKYLDTKNHYGILEYLYSIKSENGKNFECEEPEKVVPMVKRLLLRVDGLRNELMKLLTEPTEVNNILKKNSEQNLSKIYDIGLDFKVNSTLNEYLDNPEQRFWRVQVSEKADIGICVAKIIMPLKKIHESFSFFSWDWLVRIDLHKHIVKLENKLIVITCEDSIPENLVEFFPAKSTIDRKIIFIGRSSQEQCVENDVSVKDSFGDTSIKWQEFTEDAQKRLLEKKLFKCKLVSLNLKDLLFGDDFETASNFINSNDDILGILIKSKEIDLCKIGHQDWAFIAHYDTYSKDELSEITGNSEIIYDNFVLKERYSKSTTSGNLSIEPYEFTYEEEFKRYCYKEPLERITWITKSANGHYRRMMTYDPDLYLKRNLEFPKMAINENNFKNFRSFDDGNDLLLFEWSEKNQNSRSGDAGVESYYDFCSENDIAVHWLKKEEGHYFLYRSNGDLNFLKKWKNVIKSDTILGDDLIKYINGSTIIVTGGVGSGKTSFLKRLTAIAAKSFWIFYIDLSQQQSLASDKIDTSPEYMVKYLIKASGICSVEDETAMTKLLDFKLGHKNIGRPLLFAFDSFDDVHNEESKILICSIIKKLKNKASIVVTSRSHEVGRLQKELSVLPAKFTDLNPEPPMNFLKMFWQTSNRMYPKKTEDEYDSFCSTILERLEELFGKTFVHVPLHLRLLAEGFPNCFVDFESFKWQSITDIYARFVNAKYTIYLDKKASNTCEAPKHWLCQMLTNKHSRTGFYLLFPDEFQQYSKCDSPFPGERFDLENELLRVGIITHNQMNQVEFIHNSICEYFCAEFIFHLLTRTRIHEIQSLLLNLLFKTILIKPKYELMRQFFNTWLESDEVSTEIIQELGQILEKMCQDNFLGLSSHFRQNCLHVCVIEKHRHIIEFILAVSGTSRDSLARLLSTRDSNKCTPLYYCMEWDLTLFDSMLALMPGPDVEDVICATAFRGEQDETDERIKNFIERVKSKNLAAIELIEKSRPLISRFNRAVREHNCEAMKTVLDEASDKIVPHLLSVTDEKDRTALHMAAKHGCIKVVELLLKNLAQVDVQDITIQKMLNWTPLHLAAEKGHLEVVKALVEFKATVDIECRAGATPLQNAARYDQLEVVEYLIEKAKANPMHKNKVGQSILATAAREGRTRIVNSLLKKGVDINACDRNGMTPAHHALKTNHIDIVKILLEKGADYTIQDHREKTLKDYLLVKKKTPKVKEALSIIETKERNGHFN